jgi:hypothetical protein
MWHRVFRTKFVGFHRPLYRGGALKQKRAREKAAESLEYRNVFKVRWCQMKGRTRAHRKYLDYLDQVAGLLRAMLPFILRDLRNGEGSLAILEANPDHMYFTCPHTRWELRVEWDMFRHYYYRCEECKLLLLTSYEYYHEQLKTTNFWLRLGDTDFVRKMARCVGALQCTRIVHY